MRREPKRPLIAGLLVLAVLATASVAHAAVLPITAASLSTFAAGHPCSGTLAATTPTTTGTASTVSVTPPAACAGRTVAVAVSDGDVVRQGTATAPASGSVTVTLNGTYTPSSVTSAQVAATVSGWHLDTSWSYTPPVPPPPGPIVPGNAQTVITDISWTIQNNNQACAHVSVRTNTAQNSEWRVDFNVDQAPFYGATSGYQVISGQVEFIPGSGTAVDGVLGIRGSNPGWARSTATSNPRDFTICNYTLPSPPVIPSAYTVAYSQGTWSDTQACVLATITGNGSSEFYFGWSVPIDMTPAFERIESSGREVRALRPADGSWDGQVVTFSPTLAPATSIYQATNGWQGVLRLSESRTVGLCANEN